MKRRTATALAAGRPKPRDRHARACDCGNCDECRLRKARFGGRRSRPPREAIEAALAAGEAPPTSNFEAWSRKRQAQW